MISLTQTPISQAQADKIKNWLNLPEAKRFQEYLASEAARHSARAGNFLTDPKEGVVETRIELARDEAEQANLLLQFNKVIDAIRSAEQQLSATDFGPMPISNVEPETQ